MDDLKDYILMNANIDAKDMSLLKKVLYERTSNIDIFDKFNQIISKNIIDEFIYKKIIIKFLEDKFTMSDSMTFKYVKDTVGLTTKDIIDNNLYQYALIEPDDMDYIIESGYPAFYIHYIYERDRAVSGIILNEDDAFKFLEALNKVYMDDIKRIIYDKNINHTLIKDFVTLFYLTKKSLTELYEFKNINIFLIYVVLRVKDRAYLQNYFMKDENDEAVLFRIIKLLFNDNTEFTINKTMIYNLDLYSNLIELLIEFDYNITLHSTFMSLIGYLNLSLLNYKIRRFIVNNFDDLSKLVLYGKYFNDIPEFIKYCKNNKITNAL